MGGLGSATPLPPSAAPMGSPLTQPRLMNGASKQQAVPRVVPPPDDALTPKVWRAKLLDGRVVAEGALEDGLVVGKVRREVAEKLQRPLGQFQVQLIQDGDIPLADGDLLNASALDCTGAELDMTVVVERLPRTPPPPPQVRYRTLPS
eukprot:gnl/TRDRNA2_/TRDRNA2_174191_c7_seq5.p1 gnl/TRDRNA2_/TRDRNA2_174191_c7~~gnl/TRDRNA2_/TRDRNA2_174191_c7_seq5.p1  ORF type:complete len:163 (-),score=24.21 gnl/TRDRNA2_/TRDRNA2_174191_c7_seq5:68-511(-)